MTFEELQLHEALLRVVSARGYTAATPIQAQAIPQVLAGRDLLGCAQTGAGKTAAFALPILQRLGAALPHVRPVRCLVLTATRERASQIDERFLTYGRHTSLRSTAIFGGVPQADQVSTLRKGIDVLVATPGRLLDLMSQRMVSFHALGILVLDGADRLLELGLLRDVERIIATLPRKRQTLLFSETLPPDVVNLSRAILVDPVHVEGVPTATPADIVRRAARLLRTSAEAVAAAAPARRSHA